MVAVWYLWDLLLASSVVECEIPKTCSLWAFPSGHPLLMFLPHILNRYIGLGGWHLWPQHWITTMFCRLHCLSLAKCGHLGSCNLLYYSQAVVALRYISASQGIYALSVEQLETSALWLAGSVRTDSLLALNHKLVIMPPLIYA